MHLECQSTHSLTVVTIYNIATLKGIAPLTTQTDAHTVQLGTVEDAVATIQAELLVAEAGVTAVNASVVSAEQAINARAS
jgi:hypothetical protein